MSEATGAALCEHCLTFSGIHVKHNRCCQVRMLALMPKTQRLAAFAKERSEKGDDAANALRVSVKAEYERWRAWRAYRENVPNVPKSNREQDLFS